MTDTLIIQPFANAGDKAVPPQTDSSGFVNWQLGYTPDYEIDLTVGNPQAKAVERQVQNALFNILSNNQQFWQQLGYSSWHSDMAGGYLTNAKVVRYNGTIWKPYRSLIDGNVSDPLSSSTWDYEQNSAENLAHIPMPSGGASGVLLIGTPTDFNTLTTGTWVFESDLIASGSAHAPAQTGGSTVAGMLQSMTWTYGVTVTVQYYIDRNGNMFTRGAASGSFTPWFAHNIVQSHSVDVGAVNAIVATFNIPSSTLSDGQLFWVDIVHANTGATTFTPNNSIRTPSAVNGMAGGALQGGELQPNGQALFVYNLSSDNFTLMFCSIGSLQISDAVNSHQATTLSQVNALITAAAAPELLYFLGQI